MEGETGIIHHDEFKPQLKDMLPVHYGSGSIQLEYKPGELRQNIYDQALAKGFKPNEAKQLAERTQVFFNRTEYRNFVLKQLAKTRLNITSPDARAESAAKTMDFINATLSAYADPENPAILMNVDSMDEYIDGHTKSQDAAVGMIRILMGEAWSEGVDNLISLRDPVNKKETAKEVAIKHAKRAVLAAIIPVANITTGFPVPILVAASANILMTNQLSGKLFRKSQSLESVSDRVENSHLFTVDYEKKKPSYTPLPHTIKM